MLREETNKTFSFFFEIGRETRLREVPVRGVQAAREEDGRDPGGEGGGAEQLDEALDFWALWND